MFKEFKNIFKKVEDNNKPNIEQLKKDILNNISVFKDIFNDDETIVFREFTTKIPNPRRCCLIFSDGLVNKEFINKSILMPLMDLCINKNDKSHNINDLKNNIINTHNVKISTDIDEMVGSILYGNSLLLIDGFDETLIINSKGWTERAITEPSSELIVRGPREGFIESVIINTSLIKRKINNPDLKFKFREIGVKTRTKVCISYISGIANSKILKELESRLDKIDIDGILDSNYIAELITDSPLSPFETIGYSERPDVIAAKLLEGRIAIIVDGSPVVLTVPFIFIEYFQANQDYYNYYVFASINRLLRYLAFFFSFSIPAIYISLVTYHQEMVPTALLLSITLARESVPFPTIIEALAMLLVFDLLREGGIRLPQPVGATVSIVGALVLGEAAVQAKFVSAPIVIIVALTGLSSFLIYHLKGALILLRTALILLCGCLGLYGYMFGVIAIIIHLVSIRSFGIPYMLNVGDLSKQDIKDTVIRFPWWYMYLRPKLIADKNSVRKGGPNKK